MKKNAKKIISDLSTIIFSRYETGTTGIFLGLMTDDFTCQMESADTHGSIYSFICTLKLISKMSIPILIKFDGR